MRVFGAPGPWLWISLAARSALGLRISSDGIPKADQYLSPSAQCIGNAYEPMSAKKNRATTEHRLLPSSPVLLNGMQWCRGKYPHAKSLFNPLANRVAVVMIGQPFRSKNHFTDVRSACTDGTKDAQRKLARSHMEQLVLPIEKHFGMQVDVFLSDSSCAEEKMGMLGEDTANTTSSGLRWLVNLGLLKDWYTRQRVKGVVKTPAAMHFQNRVAEAFKYVEEYQRFNLGTYEYFVFLRYDVFLDTSFLTQVPRKDLRPAEVASAHRGLSFFGHGHDFLFFFPAEMWNCASGFYDGCVRATETGSQHDVFAQSDATRRQHGCFQFGPLQLPEWHGGFGLAAFWMTLEGQMRGVRMTAEPQSVYQKNGTSCFESSGRERRCVGNTYYPPRTAFENRFQPCYYHVG